MRLLVLPILMVLLGCSSAKKIWDVKKPTAPVGTRGLPDPSTCYTAEQEEGECVKYTMCDLEAPKIDPSLDFIYRTQDPPDHNQCGIFKMCCPRGNVRSVPIVPTMSPTPGCGYSYPGGVFREKTGTSKSGYADFGEFPWMVALLKKHSGGEVWVDHDYIGGGTLIHPSVVITVAHKVDTLQGHELKCRAGEWNTHNEDEFLNYQERDVNRILIHPEYSRLRAINNVALLFMETEFVIEAHVNVACLGRRLPPPGTVCYSMGWGKDFLMSDYYANVLKKITLPLVDPWDCEMKLRETRLGRSYSLHETLTCAGGDKNVDTCIGDGGSSLVCHLGDPGDLRYVVIGMVSYGLECGTENVPGVYVNVPQVYSWIKQQV